MKKIKSFWESWYSHENNSTLKYGYDFWLDKFIVELITKKNTLVLDLGSGFGNDTDFLLKLGFNVISADISFSSLNCFVKQIHNSKPVQFDIRKVFPFPNSRFGIILANLSLHYFSYKQTNQIIEELANISKPDGLLLLRVNSKSDQSLLDFSINGKGMIEKDFFVVKGIPRRYFDEQNIKFFFSSFWKIITINEKMINYHGNNKKVWEVFLRKK